MGAVFAVELARASGADELPGTRLALVAGASQPLRRPTRTNAGAVTLLVGGERHGLPPDLVERCELAVAIPIASESLNAAMAATVALYEMTREEGTVPAA
jgi:TrmH family RNA methyltransferase